MDEISNTDYGIHYLILYSDLVTLREFYSYYVQKQIEERNELVQIASFYENEDAVRQTLCEGHRAIDVKNLEQEKSLVVVDSLNKYFANTKNIRSIGRQTKGWLTSPRQWERLDIQFWVM